MSALTERLEAIRRGPVLSERDATLCLSIPCVQAVAAAERIRKLESLAAVCIAHALEQALNNRPSGLEGLDTRQQELQDVIIAEANHAPDCVARVLALGLTGYVGGGDSLPRCCGTCLNVQPADGDDDPPRYDLRCLRTGRKVGLWTGRTCRGYVYDTTLDANRAAVSVPDAPPVPPPAPSEFSPERVAAVAAMEDPT